MNFKELRAKAEKTAPELAAELGVNTTTWYRWENGEHRFPAAMLPKLQEILGLSDSEVMGIIKTLQREAS